MKCRDCGDETMTRCDACSEPTCSECYARTDPECFCEPCDDRLTAESLEAVGGERLMRAIAAQERWEREAEGTT